MARKTRAQTLGLGGARFGEPFTAAVSLASHKGKFVRAGSVQGEVNLANGASNSSVLGVLINAPTAGQQALVAPPGYVTAIGRGAACNLTYGKFVICASDGLAEPVATAAGSPVCGKWLGASLTAGASSEGTLLFFGMTACHVAAS